MPKGHEYGPEIHRKVKALRDHGLSQGEISRRTGMNQSVISVWERNGWKKIKASERTEAISLEDAGLNRQVVENGDRIELIATSVIVPSRTLSATNSSSLVETAERLSNEMLTLASDLDELREGLMALDAMERLVGKAVEMESQVRRLKENVQELRANITERAMMVYGK